MLADKNTEFMVDVPSYPQRTDFPTTPTIFSSELLEEYRDNQTYLFFVKDMMN